MHWRRWLILSISFFCCPGTTRREAGSKEAFVHADYTLVVDTALAGKRLGAQHMLVVSAMGANAHSPFFYNRVKGEMEEALMAQEWPRLTIARPSMLLGIGEHKRANETLFAPLFRFSARRLESYSGPRCSDCPCSRRRWRRAMKASRS